MPEIIMITVLFVIPVIRLTLIGENSYSFFLTRKVSNSFSLGFRKDSPAESSSLSADEQSSYTFFAYSSTMRRK